MPSNVRQLLENGTPIYPITERSLVIGLQDAPFEYYVLAWDGASTPVVSKIPAGVVVTYNNTNYTGTLAASATTAPYLYLVASTTQAGEYDRYIVTNNGNNTFSWTPVGSTAPVTPVIVDDLVTNDATKALSAKQGKVLKDELSQFEAKVDEFVADDGDTSDDFHIADPNGNAIVKFSGGHIATKNFNSETAVKSMAVSGKTLIITI